MEQKLPAIKNTDFSSIKLDVDGFKLSLKERELALAMVVRCYTKETVQEIADRLGYSREALYKVIQRNEDFDRFQAYLYEQLFSDLYGKAVVVLHDIIDNSHSSSQKLKAVQLILQAHGKFKNEHNVTVEPKRDLTLEELEQEMKEREAKIEQLEKELLED